MQQHVVEFIDGIGVKTDGVINESDNATPFNWVVPVGVTKLYITGCGGGAGGSGGHDSATSAGGGGGGGSGLCALNVPIDVTPGETLSIAIGSGGTGGTAGQGATSSGGNTTVSPVQPSIFNVNSTTFKLLGGGAGAVPGSTNLNGRTGGRPGLLNAVVTQAGGTNGSTPTVGTVGGNTTIHRNFTARGGSGGGGANTTGSNPGADGGGSQASVFLNWMHESGVTAPSAGLGGTNGSRSSGGGGVGGNSLFGNGGNGGGNAGGTSQNGTNATGYGAGGGGGGGGGNGGNGTKGYIRFVYWSAD